MRLHPLANAAVALALLLLAGCGEKPKEAGTGGGAPVSAALVVEKEVTETQEFSGRLEAIERVEVRPRVGGYITSVNFTPGGTVRKGDVLFVIDTRPFQAELNRAEAASASARARADLAKVELTRAERLLADRAIAQREYDERASGLKELDANLRAAQAQLETARLNLTYTKVIAPISGRVSKAEITVGNLVDASAVLTSIVSLDKIYASFDGDEETYLRVGAQAHKGQPVTVRIGLANEKGFPHEGKLEFVDNRLDPQAGSVRMRATFANADNLLVPGLFARVQVSGNQEGKATRAFLINERAVGTDQNRKFVFVVGRDSKAEYRPVVLGPVIDGLRVVREGLERDEKIVVGGLQRVRPGAMLSPQMVSMDYDPGAAPPDKPKEKVAAASAASSVPAKE
jgi:multidrug efflux system membrane fusion protein